MELRRKKGGREEGGGEGGRREGRREGRKREEGMRSKEFYCL